MSTGHPSMHPIPHPQLPTLGCNHGMLVVSLRLRDLHLATLPSQHGGAWPLLSPCWAALWPL